MTALRVEDPHHMLAEVRLLAEPWKRQAPLRFGRVEGGWALELPALAVDRLEYRLERVLPDGSPAGPEAPGADGPHELVLDGYRPPDWLDATAPQVTLEPLAVPCASLGGEVSGLTWCAPGLGPDTPAPLLVVHDGPEYAQRASLGRWLAASVARGALPPMRAALLAPLRRGDDYAASDAYADALALELLPALEARLSCPGPRHRALLGASLGGLAAFHAHRRHRGLVGALVVQSGSFFRHHLDPQEAWFDGFGRIDAFVAAVAGAGAWDDPVGVALTCGTGEENLANNLALVEALRAQGYPVTTHFPRDGHTWTCWRDGLDAALPVLAAAWG